MIGQTIHHFKILEELGEGGMGAVYKAHDENLDRHVALKFLSGHLAANKTDVARITKEAKAAAALNHPNICTICGIDGQEPEGRGVFGQVRVCYTRRRVAVRLSHPQR